MTDQNYDPESGVTPTPATGGQVRADVAFAGDDANPTGYGSRSSGGAAGPASATGTYGAADDRGAVEKAKDVADHAADRASDVKDTAVAKAGEVKDVAVERGGDVADVAKDEIARLASEASGQAQDLWALASSQLRDQVDTGRQQLADLLHSLADELGEMASRSTQSGPVTSLAKQAAYRGGELSHWLANTEPSDLLNDIRRFARRRPVVFFGGAALAGVLVGRLGRGLMATAQDSGPAPTRRVTGVGAYGSDPSYGSVPATGGVTTTPAVSYEEVPDFGSGEGPQAVPGYPNESSSLQPTPGDAAGGVSR